MSNYKSRLYKQSDGENYFSFSLVTKLITEYKCRGNQITIYMAIADAIMKDGDNAVSIDYLRSVTGLNRATIPIITDALHEKGLIEKWIPNTIPRTTHYKINWLNQDSEGAK